MLARTFSRHISTETAIWRRQSAWQRQLPTKFYFVSFRCYNTSEKVCLQRLFHAIFQQKRRFGKDKAHGNGSCRQNSILSRFDVIISSTQTYCQYVCKNFTLFFSRKYIKMASGIRKFFRIPPLSTYYFKWIYIIIYNSAKYNYFKRPNA